MVWIRIERLGATTKKSDLAANAQDLRIGVMLRGASDVEKKGEKLGQGHRKKNTPIPIRNLMGLVKSLRILIIG